MAYLSVTHAYMCYATQSVHVVDGALAAKRSVIVNTTQDVIQSQESASVYLAGLDTPAIKVNVIPVHLPDCLIHHLCK